MAIPPLLFYCSQCTSPDHKQGGMTETNKRHQGRKHRLCPFPLVDGHIFNNSFVDVFLLFCIVLPVRLSIYAMPCCPFASNWIHTKHTIRTMHTPSIHPCKEGENSSPLLPFRSRPFPSRCTQPLLSFVLSIHPSLLLHFPPLPIHQPPSSPAVFPMVLPLLSSFLAVFLYLFIYFNLFFAILFFLFLYCYPAHGQLCIWHTYWSYWTRWCFCTSVCMSVVIF